MKNVMTAVHFGPDTEDSALERQMIDACNAHVRGHLANLPELRQQLIEFYKRGAFDAILANLEAASILANQLFSAWYASSTETLEAIPVEEVMLFFSAIKPYYQVLWDDVDVRFHRRIPKSSFIYRGDITSEHQTNGFSWSRDPGIAACYSERAGSKFILRATVAKEDILAVFHQEQEIVPAAGSVMDITQILIDDILNAL